MTNTLRVGRLDCTYAVPRDHPAPQLLRSELDDLARHHVADSLGRALDELLDPGDPSVWLIRDLHLEVTLDAHGADPHRIAAFWGARMAQSVAAVVARGGDGERVLRFPNRAAYLAYLLRHLAAGTAWNRWYFASFDGLRSLPPAAAIREAFLREPLLAEAVLIELTSSNQLGPVVERLSAMDQEAILLCCAGKIAHADDALKAALTWVVRNGVSRASLLSVYVAVRGERPDLAAFTVAGAARDVIVLMDRSRVAGGLEDRLRGWDSRKPLASDPEEGRVLERLARLGAEDPEWLERMQEDARQHGAFDLGAVSVETAYGCLFLLLPTLFKTRELQQRFGGPGDAVLRYLLFFVLCSADSSKAWRDPALLYASGLTELPGRRDCEQVMLDRFRDADALPEDTAYFESAVLRIPSASPVSEELRSQLSVAAAILARRFAAQLPGIGESSMAYLWRNVLAGPGRLAASPREMAIDLESRPLQIVLRMAGLGETRYRLPWNEAMSVVVRFETP